MANLNDNDRAFIERYVEDALTLTEQAEFSQRYATDMAFAAEVERYRRTLTAIQAAGRTRLKTRLQAHAAQQQAKQSPFKFIKGGSSVSKMRWILGASAAASILLIWFMFGYLQPQRLTFDEAFQSNFKAAQSGGIEKGGSTEHTRLDLAYAAYDNEDYQKSLMFFSQLDNLTPKSRFLQANARMALDDVNGALPILMSLQSNPDFKEQREEVDWRIALCYLKKGDITYLKNIEKASNHHFSKDAAALLKKLK